MTRVEAEENYNYRTYECISRITSTDAIAMLRPVYFVSVVYT